MKLKRSVILNRRPTMPAPRRIGRLLRQGPRARAPHRRSSLQPHVTDAATDQSAPLRRAQGLATRRQRPDGTSA
jgi:hypothetical protein